jgi:cbb3-type cytochrome oxidase cytochrome c subunit
LLQAQSWSSERPWIDSVNLSAPFWTIRVVSGAMVITGFVFLALGVMTGASPRELAVPRDFTIEARRGERVVPRVIGLTYIIIFLVGVVFFALSFVVLGVQPARALHEEIVATTPADLAGPTSAENRGRHVFAREGCAFCHTQQIRTTEEDVRRFGPATAAWETRNDLPHMLGTRRIGPDLSRESGLRPNDWHLMHLFEPRAVEPGSVMPGFRWLFDGSPARPTREALDLVAYLQSLGRERQQAGTAPGAPHCNCKAVDTTAPLFAISRAAGDIERGEGIFQRRCIGCHGPRGHGDGVASALLYPHPADLTVAAFSAARLSSVLWNGVPATAMPKFRELSKEELKSVIAFVASLGPATTPAAGDLTLGRTVFAVRCASCHGPTGRGDGPSDMFTPRLPANFHDKQPTVERAMHVLHEGIPGTAMVRMDQNMSAAQRDAVIAYVRSLYDVPQEVQRP